MTKDAELRPQLREAEHRGWSWRERQELRPVRAPCSAGHSSSPAELPPHSSHTQPPLCKMKSFSPCSEKWETEKAVLELIKTILIASWSLTARFQLTPKSHLYPLQPPHFDRWCSCPGVHQSGRGPSHSLQMLLPTFCPFSVTCGRIIYIPCKLSWSFFQFRSQGYHLVSFKIKSRPLAWPSRPSVR